MRKELVDQLTIRAAPLDTVTIANQHHTLPHRPSAEHLTSVSPPRLPDVGRQAVWARRRAERRLTETWLIHDEPVGVKCRQNRGGELARPG
jgi:hypothetical protein